MIFGIELLYDIYSQFYKTPLYTAIEKGNPEIIQLLLTRQELDVNLKSI